MKPVSIRFKCFGPYMAEQYIDFALLEKNGLFLICGETGSGKTTILDAMSYALYGRSSGGSRGGLENMRCKLAGKDDETLVEFVFDCGGQRYKFQRSLKMARKNLNDRHSCSVLKDGVYVPILENPKFNAVNQEAQRIIGLTYDQFRQVIILPQGQFEKLLVSDSAEKEKILVSLFHADQWQRIADRIAEQVAGQDSALKQERAAMTAKLTEYGVSDLPGLRERLAADTAVLESLRQQAAAEELALAELKQQRDEAVEANKEFEELANREKALAKLEQQAARFAGEEQRLERADRAEGIRPRYEAYQTAASALDTAQGRLQAAREKLERAAAAESRARQRQENHERLREDNQGKRQKLTLLENAGELYETLGEKKAAAEGLARELKAARAAQADGEQAFKTADSRWQEAMAAQSRAQAQYDRAQSLYLAGIGGVLAAQLVPGQPCRVCGSTHHPAPAVPAADHVTEGQLEEQNRAVRAASQAVSRAFDRRRDAEAAQEEARRACGAVQEQEAAARAAYESALKQKIEGIDSAEALSRTIRTLRRDIADYEAAEREISRQLTEAQGDCKAARELLHNGEAALDTARQTCREQQSLWQAALREAGLADDRDYLTAVMEPAEKQRRQTGLIQFRTDRNNSRTAVQTQREKLAGREKPDLPGLERACRQAEQTRTVHNKQLGAAEERLETLERDLRSLTERRAAYDLQRQRVDADLEFARRLRGQTGVSLQRYVLGVMLTSITAAANRLLKHVHGGRYQLYRTDEVAGSGHKSGLELEVWDARNNERRSVTTLSGGEKFLVALSLAIGLSTVVQAQGSGIRLEAMFIDEGFGSLDSGSINDALEVLQGIRRSAGVVGIISHVEQLAETIPTQIHIIKNQQGSRCELRL